jgi:hypothetical protein
MAEGLRLIAEDADDLRVVSACVQDALAKVGDITYLPKTRQFALLLNRFRWEAASGGDVRFADVVAGRVAHAPHERVRAALSFGGVLRVQRLRLAQEAADHVLELLSLALESGQDGAATLTLTFAGGPQLRLDVECIDVRLEDVGKPWPVRRRPAHALE